jgi:hypothetical protein
VPNPEHNMITEFATDDVSMQASGKRDTKSVKDIFIREERSIPKVPNDIDSERSICLLESLLSRNFNPKE